jgi:nucleotide-binding universal stress UspA family protein
MYERIMIVVGPVPHCQIAITEGVALARVLGAEAVFFSVLPQPLLPAMEMPVQSLPTPAEYDAQARAETERELLAAEARARKAGVRCRHVMGSGVDDAHCIAEAAAELRCDLVVVSSAGRNAVMRLLTGSVIPGLITHAKVPVLVCRQASPGSLIERLDVDERRPRRRRRAGVAEAPAATGPAGPAWPPTDPA